MYVKPKYHSAGLYLSTTLHHRLIRGTPKNLVNRGKGEKNFKLSLNLFSGKILVCPCMRNDFFVAVVLRDCLLFEVNKCKSRIV